MMPSQPDPGGRADGTEQALLWLELDPPRAVKEYPATAHREGDLWVLYVPGVGATQEADWEEARAMAVDLLAGARGVDPASVRITVTKAEPTARTDEDGEAVAGHS